MLQANGLTMFFMEVVMKLLFLYSIIFFSYFTCQSSTRDPQAPIAVSNSDHFPSSQSVAVRARRLSNSVVERSPIEESWLSNQNSTSQFFNPSSQPRTTPENLLARSQETHRKSVAFSEESPLKHDVSNSANCLRHQSSRLSPDSAFGIDSSATPLQDTDENANYNPKNYFIVKIPKKYVEYGIVGIGAIAWLLLQRQQSMPKRSFGIPTDAISVGYSVLSGISSYASSGIAMLGALYAWNKFSGFIHSGCKRDLKDKDVEFKELLEQYNAQNYSQMQKFGQVQTELAEIVAILAEQLDEKNPTVENNQTVAQALETLKHTRQANTELKNQTPKVIVTKKCCGSCSVQ